MRQEKCSKRERAGAGTSARTLPRGHYREDRGVHREDPRPLSGPEPLGQRPGAVNLINSGDGPRSSQAHETAEAISNQSDF
jgi:hypothetical protein